MIRKDSVLVPRFADFDTLSTASGPMVLVLHRECDLLSARLREMPPCSPTNSGNWNTEQYVVDFFGPQNALFSTLLRTDYKILTSNRFPCSAGLPLPSGSPPACSSFLGWFFSCFLLGHVLLVTANRCWPPQRLFFFFLRRFFETRHLFWMPFSLLLCCARMRRAL